MTRKLASVQKVVSVEPIQNADAIEAVGVLGWKVVAKKGEFKVGDLVVYYEIDSFLNSNDSRYDSFSDRFIDWNGKRGMRLKTIKLRGQVSQGLILPLDKFPEVKNPKEGDDLTEILKIEKWESVEDMKNNSGNGKLGAKTLPFPFFLKKTDQERVQNITHLNIDEEFQITVKKDGSSMTVFRVDYGSKFYEDAKDLYRKKHKTFLAKAKQFFADLKDKITGNHPPVFGICSRNILLDLNGDGNFHKAVAKYDLFNKLRPNTAIQGEVVAPDIQGNYEKVNSVEFHMFDSFDIENQVYNLPHETTLYSFNNSIPHIRELESTTLRNFLNVDETTPHQEIIQKILDKAEGQSDNPSVKREGIVFKSNKRDFSFKAISNSYLLKKKD